MKRIFLIGLVVLISSISFADTILLKSGIVVDGKIVEKEDDYIRVDAGIGVDTTYYIDEIENINDRPVSVIKHTKEKIVSEIYTIEDIKTGEIEPPEATDQPQEFWGKYDIKIQIDKEEPFQALNEEPKLDGSYKSAPISTAYDPINSSQEESLFENSEINSPPKDLTGWEKVRWGMTTEEIISLYGDKIKKLPRRDIFFGCYVDYILPKYEILGTNFKVYFQMDKRENKLKAVLIRLIEKNAKEPRTKLYEAIESLLASQYGTPQELKKRDTYSQKVWSFPTTSINLQYSYEPSIKNSMLTIRFVSTEESSQDRKSLNIKILGFIIFVGFVLYLLFKSVRFSPNMIIWLIIIVVFMIPALLRSIKFRHVFFVKTSPTRHSQYPVKPGKLTNIADNAAKDQFSTYGNKIVWTDLSNGMQDVCIYDLQTGKKRIIYTNKYKQRVPPAANPSIYENQVAFIGCTAYHSNKESCSEAYVMLHDIYQNQTKRLFHAHRVEDFVIQKEYLYVLDSSDSLFAYNLNTNQKAVISKIDKFYANDRLDQSFDVDGNRFVYLNKEAYRADMTVCQWDMFGSLSCRLIDKAYDYKAFQPRINQGKIVFTLKDEHKTDGNINIYNLMNKEIESLRDIEDSMTYIEEDDLYIDNDTDIFGHRLIWTQDCGGASRIGGVECYALRLLDMKEEKIYSLDKGRNYEVIGGFERVINPKIENNLVIWQESNRDNNGFNLYVYELKDEDVALNFEFEEFTFPSDGKSVKVDLMWTPVNGFIDRN